MRTALLVPLVAIADQSRAGSKIPPPLPAPGLMLG